MRKKEGEKIRPGHGGKELKEQEAGRGGVAGEEAKDGTTKSGVKKQVKHSLQFH